MNTTPPTIHLDLTGDVAGLSGEARRPYIQKAITSLLKQLPTEACANDSPADPYRDNVKGEASSILTELRKFLREYGAFQEMTPRNPAWVENHVQLHGHIERLGDAFSATYSEFIKDPWNRELDLRTFVMVNEVGATARIFAPDDKTPVLLVIRDTPISALS